LACGVDDHCGGLRRGVCCRRSMASRSAGTRRCRGLRLGSVAQPKRGLGRRLLPTEGRAERGHPARASLRLGCRRETTRTGEDARDVPDRGRIRNLDRDALLTRRPHNHRIGTRSQIQRRRPRPIPTRRARSPTHITRTFTGPESSHQNDGRPWGQVLGTGSKYFRDARGASRHDHDAVKNRTATRKTADKRSPLAM
jgi:hypothetical protein